MGAGLSGVSPKWEGPKGGPVPFDEEVARAARAHRSRSGMAWNRVSGAAALTTRWALPAAGTPGVLAGYSRIYYRTHRQRLLLRCLSARVGRGGVVDRRRLRRSDASSAARKFSDGSGFPEVSGSFRRFPELSGSVRKCPDGSRFRFKRPRKFPEVSGSFRTLTVSRLARACGCGRRRYAPR